MSDFEPWFGKTVLIVDDSIVVREELAEVYETLGLEVLGFAEDGFEALQRYEDLKPDLISMDLIMPVMHGMESYRILKGKFNDVKAVFVSCLQNDHELFATFSKYVSEDHFHEKPVDLEKLKESLRLYFGDLRVSSTGGEEEETESSENQDVPPPPPVNIPQNAS